MGNKKYKAGIYVILICLILSSSIALLVPFVNFNEDGTGKIIGYVAGVIFWIGLIAGLLVYGLVTNKCKKRHAFDKMDKKRIGLISFFSNFEAKIADIIFVLALVINIVLFFINGSNMWIDAIAAFILLVSFHCHYVFNGKTYQYIFK